MHTAKEGRLSPASKAPRKSASANDDSAVAPATAGRSRKAANEKPVPPWRRAEAGQYRSSDDRFTIGSEGPSRWFVTDDAEQDEFGLARTIGPFPTLDAAKAAAEDHRSQTPEASPLADRVARDAPARAGANGSKSRKTSRKAAGTGTKQSKPPDAKSQPAPPPPPPKTWLDTLADDDRDAARRARRLIAALEDAGVREVEALVRRDVVGNQPVVAARLLATAILRALDAATRHGAIDRLARRLPEGQRDAARARLAATAAAEAVLAVLGGSKSGPDLPGWRLVERDGPPGEPRAITLGARDLRDAAERATED